MPAVSTCSDRSLVFHTSFQYRRLSCFLYMSMVVLTLQTILPSVSASGKFSIRIYGFENYRKTRMDGQCCQTETGSKFQSHNNNNNEDCSVGECATKLRVCLTEILNYEITDRPKPFIGKCIFGNYSTPQIGVSSFGYIKPFTVRLKIDFRWTRSFTLILEAYDVLPNSKEEFIIDRAVYKGILVPGAKHSVIKYITKLGNAFEYNLKMECDKNYYNVTCSTFCKPRNDFHGHYKCNAVGEKVCEPGWGGKDCNAPICKVGCHSVHGSCDQPGECKCADGWQGAYCTECIKYPGCKHGTCNNSPWSCKCFLNWGGRFCDKDLNYCGRHQPCKNKGICLPYESGKSLPPYRCICPLGFNGTNCENQIPPCLTKPCQNGGTCYMRGTNKYYCNCPKGWHGSNCEKNKNACTPGKCINGGTCFDLQENDDFKCLCLPGYTGKICQIPSPCSNAKCVNAIKCADDVHDDVKCTCQPGWKGKYCDENINDCNGQCKNGGKCTDLVLGYYCTCAPGFRGRHCEIDVDECRLEAGNPCLNGGICRDERGGFSCDCPKDYGGKRCEIDKTPCDPNPCFNEAYCYNMGSDFYCKCNENYYGKRCEILKPSCDDGICEVVDPCSLPYPLRSNNNKSVSGSYHSLPSTICGSRGRCLSLGSGKFRCECDPGFKGRYCHININECENNPCLNSATCLDGTNDFECLCREGFRGKRCEYNRNECSPNPCWNNGVCIDMENDFQCKCVEPWKGRWCQVRDNPCRPHTCLNEGNCLEDDGINEKFKCHCTSEWVGTQCHKRRIDPCKDGKTQCRNGGTCVHIGNLTHCICKDGYEGKYCQIKMNRCEPNPCFNGGTCRDLTTTFECVCQRGFAGPDCRINLDDCASNPCSYGAACIDGIGGYKCNCPEGRDGKHCDEVIGEVMPKPPSCIYRRRIYDHGKTWSMDCKICSCDKGKVKCKDEDCGHKSCASEEENNKYACKKGQKCVHIEIRRGSCFVEPCFHRDVCRNSSVDFSESKVPWASKTDPSCRPNSLSLNNRCSRIRLTYNRMFLPYGVTVDDICQAIRNLKIVQKMRGQYPIGITCDIQQYNRDVIEVAVGTESDTHGTLDDSLEDFLKKRPIVHQLADLIGNAIKRKESPDIVLRTVLKVQVETLLLNSEDWEPTYLLPLLCVLVALGVCLIVLIVLHHIREKKKILLKYAPYQKANNKPENETAQTGQVSRCRNILFPRSDGRGGPSSSRRSERGDSESKEVRRPLKSAAGDRGIEISAPVTHPPIAIPGTSNDSGIETNYSSNQRTSKQFLYGSRAATSSKNVNVAQRMSGDYERGSPLVV